MKKAVEEILNCGLPENQWTIACLPVSYGGLGIRRATDVARPAFLASNKATKWISDKNDPFIIFTFTVEHTTIQDALTSLSGMGLQPPNDRGVQIDWDAIACEASTVKILESLEGKGAERARFIAARPKHSGAWLNCMPLSNLGLKLHDDKFE